MALLFRAIGGGVTMIHCIWKASIYLFLVRSTQTEQLGEKTFGKSKCKTVTKNAVVTTSRVRHKILRSDERKLELLWLNAKCHVWRKPDSSCHLANTISMVKT